MGKKILLFFLVFGVITVSISQEHQKFLYANVKDNIGSLYNAHVINLTTKQGAFTNENGEFRILAKKNDSLKISFIGYKTKIILVKLNHFGISDNTFSLEKTTYELDEINIKKHDLFGFLSRDMKQTPEDIAIVKSKGALDFSKIDFEKIVISRIDEIDRAKAPNMQKETDPIAKFSGIKGGFSSGIDKYSADKRKFRKDINFKEKFPEMLISEFGEKFFFIDLKIPKEKYFHFLEYCNPLGIEELYKEGKVLETIKILQHESKSYLKIITLQE